MAITCPGELTPNLAPAVGYSREQMIDALRHFIGPFRSIDIEYYMNSLTPAAEVVGSSDVVDLQAVRDQLEIQGRDGNWNFDQYMAGMYNGLECALATLEDREPEYRKLPAPASSVPVHTDWKHFKERQAECKHDAYDAMADWCHDCQSVLNPKDAYVRGYDQAVKELTKGRGGV